MSRRWNNRTVPTVSAIFAVALMGALAACGGSSDGDGQGDSKDAGSTPLKVLLQPVPWSTPALIAEEQGFFEDEGLDVDLEIVANQAAQVPLMVTGQAQFAVGANLTTGIVLGQGMPFKIVATSTRNESDEENATSGILVNSDSDIRSASDLVGTKVAMPALRGAAEYLVRVAIDLAGEDGNDVHLVQLDQAAGIAALEKGEVDAALAFQPFLAQALADGKKAISYPSLEEGAGKMFTHWYANADYLEENSATADKFVAAIEKANDYANEHPDEANALLGKALSMPDEIAGLLPVTTYGGDVSEEDVQWYFDVVKKYGWNEKELPPAGEAIWSSGS